MHIQNIHFIPQFKLVGFSHLGNSSFLISIRIHFFSKILISDPTLRGFRTDAICSE